MNLPVKIVFNTGNNRLSYTFDHESQQVKILEENNYYPFGLKHHYYNEALKTVKYKEINLTKKAVQQAPAGDESFPYYYQEQERQDELGLNWDSFKYRNYDYAIARFMSIDALAEKYSYQSPYNFSENRVIDARELEGLEAVDVDDWDFQWNDNLSDDENLAALEAVPESNKLDAVEITVNTPNTLSGEFNYSYEQGKARYESKFLGADANYSFLLAEGKYRYNNLFDFDLDLEAAYFKEDFTLRTGTDKFNHTYSGNFSFLSADAKANFEASENGLKADFGAGVYVLKTEITSTYTLFGAKLDLTLGVTGGSLHRGFARAIYYENGELTIEKLFHKGIIGGYKYDYKLTLPIQNWTENALKWVNKIK